jgi:hypothetical protein
MQTEIEKDARNTIQINSTPLRHSTSRCDLTKIHVISETIVDIGRPNVLRVTLPSQTSGIANAKHYGSSYTIYISPAKQQKSTQTTTNAHLFFLDLPLLPLLVGLLPLLLPLVDLVLLLPFPRQRPVRDVLPHALEVGLHDAALFLRRRLDRLQLRGGKFRRGLCRALLGLCRSFVGLWRNFVGLCGRSGVCNDVVSSARSKK